METNHWEVTVGNIGSVHTGTIEGDARKEFADWCEASYCPHGRASGESVALWCNGNLRDMSDTPDEE